VSNILASTVYAVTARVQWTDAQGTQHHRDVPTFWLHANTQGIVSESHAKRIAREVVDPFNMYPHVSIGVAARPGEEA
jgi:hypothetical protein